MSEFDSNQNLTMRDAFMPIVRVLKGLGGHFTFTDTDGEQYVVVKKSEFEAQTQKRETQLRITSVSEEVSFDTDEEDLSRVNEDIAMSHVGQEEGPDDLSVSYQETEIEMSEDAYTPPAPPPVRIRFEPIKGDLPPDLQE